MCKLFYHRVVQYPSKGFIGGQALACHLESLNFNGLMSIKEEVVTDSETAYAWNFFFRR